MAIASAQTEGLGDLTDAGLRKNLDSTLGGAGKDYTVSGDETNGWTISVDGKDYIISPSGKNYEKVEGDPTEWEVTGNAVTKYLGTSNDIIVPNYVNGTRITEIGEGIFANSDKNGTLKISEGIEKIGAGAFFASKFTGSLSIPESVKEIGRQSFYSCSNLTGSLIIPQSVNAIRFSAFYSCSGFTGNLNIPGTVDIIEDMAFGNCTGFNGRLTLNHGIKKIGGYVFGGCSNFRGDLIIPESIEANSVFDDCTGFDGNLIIEEGVKIRGLEVFAGFSGKDFIILDNTEISAGAFGTNNKDGNFTGTLYIGKNSKTNVLNSVKNIKRAVMHSIPLDMWGIQNFNQLKICWISKDVIANINTLSIQTCPVAPENLQIYTDASSDDANWPSNFPKDNLQKGITVHYNTSEEDFMKLEY